MIQECEKCGSKSEEYREDWDAVVRTDTCFYGGFENYDCLCEQCAYEEVEE